MTTSKKSNYCLLINDYSKNARWISDGSYLVHEVRSIELAMTISQQPCASGMINLLKRL